MDAEIKDFNSERHLFLMVKDVDPANPNIVHATVSTDEIDRYNEVVLPSAFREALGPFLINPVVLPAHQHHLDNGEPPVIGNVLTGSIVINQHNVDMDIEFDDDELGQKYARKYQKKIMRAFSIGFRGLEGEYKELEGKRIWIWTKIELLEVSAVAVPANRGALARVTGYYDRRPDDERIAEAVKAAVADQLCDIYKQLCDMKSLVETELDEIKSLLIADPDRMAESLIGADLEPSSRGGGEDTGPDELSEALKATLLELTGDTSQ